jgi:hypothetical protein
LLDDTTFFNRVYDAIERAIYAEQLPPIADARTSRATREVIRAVRLAETEEERSRRSVT